MSLPVNLVIILGSTRPGRFSEQPGQWIFNKAAGLPDVEARLIDLRDYVLPLFDEPEPPSDIDTPPPHPVARRLSEQVAWADAFIIVTPEYNHGYPAVLKNALDYIYHEWNHKPVAFVAYGGVAGARSVEQLRQVAVALKMAPIAETVHIKNYQSLLDDQGRLVTKTLEPSGDKLLTQLVAWARALRSLREKN